MLFVCVHASTTLLAPLSSKFTILSYVMGAGAHNCCDGGVFVQNKQELHSSTALSLRRSDNLNALISACASPIQILSRQVYELILVQTRPHRSPPPWSLPPSLIDADAVSITDAGRTLPLFSAKPNSISQFYLRGPSILCNQPIIHSSETFPTH